MEQENLTIVSVTDQQGKAGTVESPIIPEDTESMVLVQLENGERLLVPARLLEPKEDGSFEFTGNFDDFLVSAGTGGGHGHAVRSGEGEPVVMPVVREELQVGKRRVETGRVRISKRVGSHDELIDVPLFDEKVEIEKTPVNRYVDGPIPVREEGDTLIVPVLEEVLVVEKRLLLKEEWRITKRRSEKHSPRSVELRHEEIVVERTGTGHDE